MAFLDERPLETLGVTATPDGRELVLYRRGDVYQIRIDGLELMGSLAFAGEKALAEEACRRLRRPDPRVLVGGLGMGFTLRAALDALGPAARVQVAEIFPAVVEWNRGPLSHLSGSALDDPRVEIAVDDVRRLLARSPAAYDAVLLDVDNGPEGLVAESNDELYRGEGLDACLRALRPGGLLAVWSAGTSPDFEARLRRRQVVFEHLEVRARPDTSVFHSLYLCPK